MDNNQWYRHKCCICSRFCKWDCDSSTDFGSCVDIEPPDPKYYCDKCTKEQEEKYLELNYVPDCWIKSKWQRRIAKEMGFIEIKSKGAAWTSWHKNGVPLPDGCVEI